MSPILTFRGKQFMMETCPNCKVEHAIPEFLYQSALARRGTEGFQVYCPNGHTWHYTVGEREEEKLRRERDRLVQRLAQKDDQIFMERQQRLSAERSAAARKGQITKLKNRAAAGVCSCCNRSFENLRRHMSTQHPTFTAEEVQ